MKKVLLAASALLAFVALARAVSPSQNEIVVLSKKSAKITPPNNPQIIPADRLFAWNPGMMSKGGVPNRTTICATLSPSGGEDSALIQAQLDTCPAGQVVFLNAGTFIISNLLNIHTGITLRGSGKGVTILNKPNGAHPRLSTIVSGTNGIHTPEDPNTYSHDQQPIIIVGPGRYSKPDESTAMNLTVDGAKDTTSVTVTDGRAFAAGQFVLLDELSGASWQTNDQPNYNASYAAVNATFTGAIAASPGNDLNVTAMSSGTIWPGDYLSVGLANTTISSQTSGTLGGVGHYIVSPGGQNVASTTITSGGPFPPLEWSGDRNVWAMRWPHQSYADEGGSNSLGPFQEAAYVTATNASPAFFTWPGTNPVGNRDGVILGGVAVPGGFTAGTLYYAVNVSGNTFNLAAKVDGAAINSSSAGTNVIALHTPAAFAWFSRIGRVTNEIKEIASVSGNTITFTSPLTISYRTSHVAQLTRYTSAGNGGVHVANAGVENLSMVGGADGELRFETTAYCWAKAVEVTQWLGEGVAINNSFRVELRDSYIHTGSWPTPGGGGYALSLANGTSEILVENNILIDANKNMVARASGAGSVVAYNYADDSWISYNTIWQEHSLNGSHMIGPHHMLFEGNYAVNADSDNTHGNSIYHTFFRNVLSGQRRDFTDSQNQRTAGPAATGYWFSFVGNILGRSGQMTGWTYTSAAMGCDANGNNCVGGGNSWTAQSIWEHGYDPGHYEAYPDPKVLSTIIRDGNYDFLTNSQRWHNTPATFAMPNSLYLTAKPAFFGNNPWPWSDPATGAIYTLPAKARYDAGNP